MSWVFEAQSVSEIWFWINNVMITYLSLHFISIVSKCNLKTRSLNLKVYSELLYVTLNYILKYVVFFTSSFWSESKPICICHMLVNVLVNGRVTSTQWEFIWKSQFCTPDFTGFSFVNLGILGIEKWRLILSKKIYTLKWLIFH